MATTNWSIVLLLTVAIAAFSLIQPATSQGYSAEQNVLYTTIVSKSLLEDMLPTVNTSVSSINNTVLRKLVDNIVKLHDVKEKINATTASSDHLNGLKSIINEVEEAACNWMNRVFKGGFECNSAKFDSLKTKLNLLNQLVETERVLKPDSC